jgi:aspartate ammonia-lyase
MAMLISQQTHFQGSVPVTNGQEFTAYGSAIKHCSDELRRRQENLYQVALGGTATGTGTNTHPEYKRLVIGELAKMTGFTLKPAANNFEALQSHRAPKQSQRLKELALDLIRIANELRLLSRSNKGLDEIFASSSARFFNYPGKVKPVMAESQHEAYPVVALTQRFS